jgi:surface antigen
MCNAHRLARATGALVVVAMMMVTTGIVVAAPAEAAPSSKTLCKGFTACVSQGRGHGGYGPVHKRSFWNMRAGHNCTNYVAYRLTHGRLVPRPPGANDSGTWGSAARKAGIPVSGTPRVGSVAWWKPRHHGASKGGHVAYVEAVRPDGSVVISEDHLGGTFMWRVLKRKGGAWPSGFIHFRESDGSPAGSLLWARGEGGGQVRLSGTASEPDVEAGQRSYLVSVGGPMGTPGVESYRFSTEFFRFERYTTLATRGPTVLFVYALNTPGTAGADRLLGTAAVSIS